MIFDASCGISEGNQWYFPINTNNTCYCNRCAGCGGRGGGGNHCLVVTCDGNKWESQEGVVWDEAGNLSDSSCFLRWHILIRCTEVSCDLVLICSTAGMHLAKILKLVGHVKVLTELDSNYFSSNLSAQSGITSWHRLQGEKLSTNAGVCYQQHTALMFCLDRCMHSGCCSWL